MSCRSQVATEYMIVVGLLLVFVTPLVYYAMVSYTTSNSVYTAQVLVSRISDSADLVYTQNPPAQKVMTILFPNNIVDSIVQNNTVGVIVTSGGGNSTVALSTKGCVSGSLPHSSGYKRILLKATDNCVNISEY